MLTRRSLFRSAACAALASVARFWPAETAVDVVDIGDPVDTIPYFTHNESKAHLKRRSGFYCVKCDTRWRIGLFGEHMPTCSCELGTGTVFVMPRHAAWRKIYDA